MPKQKTIPELKAEIAANERQLAQLRHKQQQLENLRSYYEKGDRRKRAHRLITRGAAVESVAPLAKVLTETESYSFAEKALAIPEVNGRLMGVVNEHNKNEFGGRLTIALYHFHVTQIKRGAGQSAVAAATPCSGRQNRKLPP